jgi:hypothetical protein
VASRNEARKLTQQEARDELRELVTKAKRGDATVLPRLREYLGQLPELWQHTGDLALQSQAAWVRLIAGEDKHLRECIVRRVNAMKMDLANEDTSTLENLLVERVISSWLQLYYHETREAQEEEKSLKWAEFRVKQANAANDRHIKSIGALATLRKLVPSERSEPQSTKQAIKPEPAESMPAATGETPSINGRRINGHRNGHNRLAGLLHSKETVTNE